MRGLPGGDSDGGETRRGGLASNGLSSGSGIGQIWAQLGQQWNFDGNGKVVGMAGPRVVKACVRSQVLGMAEVDARRSGSALTRGGACLAWSRARVATARMTAARQELGMCGM